MFVNVVDGRRLLSFPLMGIPSTLSVLRETRFPIMKMFPTRELFRSPCGSWQSKQKFPPLSVAAPCFRP